MIAYIDEHGNLQLIAERGDESDELNEWFHKICTKRQPYKFRKKIPAESIKITYYDD